MKTAYKIKYHGYLGRCHDSIWIFFSDMFVSLLFSLQYMGLYVSNWPIQLIVLA